MTAIQLYKFINDNDVEFRWQKNNGEIDVMIFPNVSQIEDFFNILSPSVFDDGGIDCTMMHGYFAIWMNDICKYYGIDMTEVFGIIPSRH
jgi:hypothetical protein